MRVLLAIDGSASSEAAAQLVRSITWPEATVIRVATVYEPVTPLLAGLSGMTVGTIDEPAAEASYRAMLDDAVAALRATGRAADGRMLRGRPATEIVEEALAFEAELVVVGSRGLGTLSTMVLGSVSAEVVDHAPCPVLVARAPAVGKVLLAVDGSIGAKLAIDHLGGTGYLAGHPIEVITVTRRIAPPSVSMTPYAGGAPFDRYDERVAEGRAQAEATAANAADDLRRDGFEVRWSITSGDPAGEIIEAAAALGCNLIVTGSRGHTGLDRILLGSVARNVLLHTHASVLIVREPLRERLPERRFTRTPRQAVAPVG